jgi:hypothetical protein
LTNFFFLFTLIMYFFLCSFLMTYKNMSGVISTQDRCSMPYWNNDFAKCVLLYVIIGLSLRNFTSMQHEIVIFQRDFFQNKLNRIDWIQLFSVRILFLYAIKHCLWLGVYFDFENKSKLQNKTSKKVGLNPEELLYDL